MTLKHVGERKPYEPAWFNCEAKASCGKWVQHTYSGVEEVKNAEGQLLATHDQYKCTKCGQVRRWG